MIKSVDVSPTSSTEKEMPKEEKEMSVEVSSGQHPTSANDDTAAKKKVEKISSKDLASSSTNINTSSHLDLPTFVQSRLAVINSPSVDQVFGIWPRNIFISLILEQELSGSEKATLGDLISHNMQLAHDLYQVKQKHIV